jgi:hypothetical protein
MRKIRMRWAEHVERIGRRMQIGFGGKARREETTRNTYAWVVG